VIFNLEEAGPREVVYHLWKGRQRIFYVHSCIAFALSEFRWGSLGYSGLLQWIAVQNGLKTTGLDASVKITIDVWTHSPPYCCIAKKNFKYTCGLRQNEKLLLKGSIS